MNKGLTAIGLAPNVNYGNCKRGPEILIANSFVVRVKRDCSKKKRLEGRHMQAPEGEYSPIDTNLAALLIVQMSFWAENKHRCSHDSI